MARGPMCLPEAPMRSRGLVIGAFVVVWGFGNSAAAHDCFDLARPSVEGDTLLGIVAGAIVVGGDAADDGLAALGVCPDGEGTAPV
jgi:hypothetical protein